MKRLFALYGAIVCTGPTTLLGARCDQFCLDSGFDRGLIIASQCYCADQMEIRSEPKLTLPKRKPEKGHQEDRFTPLRFE